MCYNIDFVIVLSVTLILCPFCLFRAIVVLNNSQFHSVFMLDNPLRLCEICLHRILPPDFRSWFLLPCLSMCQCEFANGSEWHQAQSWNSWANALGILLGLTGGGTTWLAFIHFLNTIYTLVHTLTHIGTHAEHAIIAKKCLNSRKLGKFVWGPLSQGGNSGQIWFF